MAAASDGIEPVREVVRDGPTGPVLPEWPSGFQPDARLGRDLRSSSTAARHAASSDSITGMPASRKASSGRLSWVAYMECTTMAFPKARIRAAIARAAAVSGTVRVSEKRMP